MKKFLASALSAALLLSALAGCSGSGSGSASGSAPAGSGASNGDKVVKIGVFEPASGDSASGGKKEVLGMQYANSETPTVELNGETYKVELVLSDNGSSTDKAPSAASDLVSKGVSLVLGTYGSGAAMASALSAILTLLLRTAVGERYYRAILNYRCLALTIGLMTAAALIPAKPVPSPAPMPAKKVTSIVNSNVISVFLL